MEFGASIFFTDYSITAAELAADEEVANGARDARSGAPSMRDPLGPHRQG